MPETPNFDPAGAIAIIGMSGRFPGAPDTRTLWRNLCQGREAISFFDDETLLNAGVPSSLLQHPDYVRAGAILEGSDQFDAGFFGMSPREAEITDPQHRVFLECAWEALEDAGYAADACPGQVAVYAGAGLNTYMIENLLPATWLQQTLGILPLMIGNKADFLPSTVSYKLGLRGESINIGTACSTSLVAVHMACRSLLAYESDMALAGGVTIAAAQHRGYLYQSGSVYSPDGHCRSFDARAQGTVGGNGAGVVVLKRLSDAQDDGDTIIAVIRASAINNDGAVKAGFTAPGVAGQRAVIAQALALAEIPPETIGYIETHGTATPMGDPIEIRALADAYGKHGAPGSCAIGSIKSNLGHLDAAAGVAGLIKAALCLRHRSLVPSLHFESPNPEIDFAATPFHVNTEWRPWTPGAPGIPLRAAVSAFGLGGTNAHAILEEAPQQAPSPAAGRAWQVLPLSAQGGAALQRAATRLADRLEEDPTIELADAAYTLQTGRKAFAMRRAVVARDTAEAIALLRHSTAPALKAHGQVLDAPSLVFMFPGIGDHYPGMGGNLYREEPVLRAHLDHCAGLLLPRLGIDIRDLLFPTRAAPAAAAASHGGDPFQRLRRTANEPTSHTALTRTEHLHPALFALEYALAQLWIDRVGPPAALIGYSLGEYTAACLAGVMSLEDALLLVCERARLIQGMPPGRMLAVGLSETAIRPMLTPSLSLAAINGPAMSVVAGPSDAVSELSGRLAEAGIAQLAVHSAHAFHSQMLAELKEPLCALFGSVKLHPPTIPYLSNRSGTWITAAEATDPHHWARHTIETVRFADGLTELCGDPQRVFLEVGPGQTLCSLVLQLTSAQPRTQPSLPAAHEADADTATLAQALAWLWSQGLPVNWAGQHAGEARRRVALPTYSFERQRYWIAAPATTDQGTPAADQPAASSSEPLQPPTDGTPFPESAFEPPASDFEAAVIDIWRELFHVEQISVNDNFFALGGNSLLAVQFFSRLRALYQVELPLRAVFQTPTPRGIATELENALLAELDKLSDDEARAQTTRDNALGHPEVPRVTPTLYTLPDGLRVWQFNQVETDHFHHDIFESRVYHRNGIRFDDRAVIFDIGANIGLFSLYASRQCHQPQIHAFEPAPPVFRLLQDNLAANAVEADLLNCGISDASGARQLTFYPLSTGMSSFHADRQQEQEVLHAIMLNQQQQGMPGMDEVMDWADQILEQRFQALDFECRMVTVSEVMRERGLARIDLMKIDVQKCELEVLQGIDDEHWPAIRQIVIEVHDLDGRVAQVAAMLRQRGYEVVVEQELLYRSSNISNLYAIRP